MRISTFLLVISFLSLSVVRGQIANHVVISEVYGGGGNSGAVWKSDFVELYNPTSSPVDLGGWSIQYASATGNFTQATTLSGIIQPKRFYLVQEAPGTGGSQDLPTPDITGNIQMGLSAGKIALVSNASFISGPADAVDFVGYGSTATPFEGTGAAQAPSNTTSIERKGSGTSTGATLAPGGVDETAGNGWDRNNNLTDFVIQSSINPQNSASPQEPIGSIPAGIGTATINPAVVRASSAVGFEIDLKGSPSGTITGLRFSKHSVFNWSTASIAIVGNSGGVGILKNDSLTFSVTAISVGAGDSLRIRIDSLSAPDTTMKVTILLETAAGSDSIALVTPLPSFVLYGTPRAIISVKSNNNLGVPEMLQQPVTVRGIVTVAQHFGGPAYLQDVSGGVAVFDRAFENAVSIGDEVTVTATVTQFNGLTELANVTLLSVDSRGNEVVPTVLTISHLVSDASAGVEFFEGMLVQLNRVTVTDANSQPIGFWTVTGSGSNYWLHDGEDSIQVRIDADVSGIANATAPTGEFDLVGVVGQFVTMSPYFGGYQLMPRFREDILSKGPIITVLPRESDITSSSMEIRWETAKPGTSFVRFGRQRSYEIGTVASQTSTTVHRIALSGLAPSTVYHVQAFSVSGSDTSFANDRVVSTASSGSTGQINVYFNKSVDPALARSEIARGNSDFVALLLRRIDAAQKSIDCALYSLSGSAGRTIADALVRALNRGVKVRLIVEQDNLSAGTGTTVSQVIGPAGIPWIADGFDAVNGGAGLMHNKFLVFDARGDAADQIWVWTGSWNLTDPGTNDDMQNVIEIQDQALAATYTMEFEEMWGSETTTPNAANSRFGARKLDNTPHLFTIQGVPVELYFSPSDKTTSYINSRLSNATGSINFALLTFTRSDLASTLKARKNAGLKVRGLLDNGTDSGSQYSFFVANEIDVRLKKTPGGLLHHKYAIIDAEQNGASQYVITGSHNWSNSAETSNNENTLFVENGSIANQYLQEFAARYKEAGGTDVPVVYVTRDDALQPATFGLAQNYPNPFNGTTNFEIQIPSSDFVTLALFDLLGRKVATLLNEARTPGIYRVRWDAGNVPSGVYYGVLTAGSMRAVRAIVLTK